MSTWWSGLLVGATGAAAALLFLGSGPVLEAGWLEANLGLSRWLFLAIGLGFLVNLVQLAAAARCEPDLEAFGRVARLDQLTEIWIHLFVGIGVVWTAIGMRDALVAALARPEAAVADSAAHVLQALVDGGILVALTSTIVGGLGGYAMKLLKAFVAGGDLQLFYGRHGAADMHRLLDSVAAIEARLEVLGNAGRRDGPTVREVA